MNLMEMGLREYLSESDLNLISSEKIGIAGCGGLGSNVAQILVRVGFKRLKIVDFDIVNKSNLNRQFYFYNQIGELKTVALEKNLKLINPDLLIEPINIKVNSMNIHNIFNDCNIIIECFDKVEYKKLLIEELSNYKKCITASGLGNFWDVDNIKTLEINKNLICVGDLKSDVNKGIPPLSPGVTITAAKQSAALLKLVLGDTKCLDY